MAMREANKEMWFVAYVKDGNYLRSCTLSLNKPVFLEKIHNDIYDMVKKEEGSIHLSLTSMNKLGDFYKEEKQEQ